MTKFWQPPIKGLDNPHNQSPEAFDRRILTAKALGRLTVELVAASHPQAVVERYEEEFWNYDDLRAYAKETGYPDGTAPQVFSRWHRLMSREMDLLPITFEYAKKQPLDLSILGAVVVSEALKGEYGRSTVSHELLFEYHRHRLKRLTDQA